MAADVRRQMNNDTKPGPDDPITRDFLGGSFGFNESKELDLDLHVPLGWEKRLDLQSGKVYIQRSKPPSPTPNHKTNQTTPSSSNTRDKRVNSDVERAPNLDLNLISILPSDPLKNHENATYQSVCTLDKVKSALERAHYKVSPSPTTSSSKKRPLSPSTSENSSMISITRGRNDEEQENGESEMLVAGACPICLLYVLISKNNPKCPKCNSFISMYTPSKKPKIDLNL